MVKLNVTIAPEDMDAVTVVIHQMLIGKHGRRGRRDAQTLSRIDVREMSASG